MDAAAHIPVTATTGLGRVEVVPPTVARAVLTVVVLGAGLAAAAYVASSPHAVGGADPALTRLLRAMALIKAGMAAGVVAVVFWRLGVAAKPIALGAYALLSAAMASGPVLIWGMTHLVLGALLLHAGLAAGALMLWRDPATTARLKALIAARSQAPIRSAGVLPALSQGAGRMPALRKPNCNTQYFDIGSRGRAAFVPTVRRRSIFDTVNRQEKRPGFWGAVTRADVRASADHQKN